MIKVGLVSLIFPRTDLDFQKLFHSVGPIKLSDEEEEKEG